VIVAALDIRDARPTEGEAIRALTLAAYEQYAAVLGPLWPMYRANIVETLARVAPAEQIVADIRRYRELGVGSFLLEARYRDLDDMVSIFERFAREIRPQVAATTGSP